MSLKRRKSLLKWKSPKPGT